MAPMPDEISVPPAPGQQHEAHDALAVDFLAVFFHLDIRGKAIGHADKHGRRSRMEAELIPDDEIPDDGNA